MAALFRPKRESHVDRSAGDRLRHRQKVRTSIRDNIADIIAEESIIGRSGDRIVKVPIRGIKDFFPLQPGVPGDLHHTPCGCSAACSASSATPISSANWLG